MRRHPLVSAILIASMLAYAETITFAAEGDDYLPPDRDSDVFRNSYATSITKLGSEDFDQNFHSPALNAASGSDFDRQLAAINRRAAIAGVSLGDPDIEYDVILQPGHYLRTAGATGTSGKLVSEQALVAYLVDRTAAQLRDKGLNVLVVSADNYVRPRLSDGSFVGLHSKIFLAIHADGSVAPCSAKPSLGYGANSSPMAMHAIGWALGQALGYRYDNFERDNYTVNEAHYYMFNIVRTDRLTGLLEVGELTCDKRERELIGSADIIANNVANALEFLAGINGS